MGKKKEPAFWDWLFENSCCCGDRGKGKEYTEEKTNTPEPPTITYPHLQNFPNEFAENSEPSNTDNSLFSILGATETSTLPSGETIEITQT